MTQEKISCYSDKVPPVLKAFIRIEEIYAETVMETMALGVERTVTLRASIFFFKPKLSLPLC